MDLSKDMAKPKIGIFIIAYNAVNHLIETISRIPKDVYDEVCLLYTSPSPRD